MSRGQSSGVAALIRDYRAYAGAKLWLALAVMLLGALAEGFGLLMIVPLVSVAIGRRADKVSALIPGAARLSPTERFVGALILFVGAMALRSLLLFLRDVLNVRLETGYEASLRLRAATTLASRGWGVARRVGEAGMQSLLLNDVPRAAQAIGVMQQIAIAGAMLVVPLALAAFLAPVLTAIALAFMVVAALAGVRWTRRGVGSGVAISERMEESAGAGLRLHAGLKAALAQGSIAAFLEEYRTSLAATARQFTIFARDYSTAHQLASFGAALAAALLLFVGERLLALTFPVLVASLVLFARMSGPAQALQLSVQRVAALTPAFVAIQRRLGGLEQLHPVAAQQRPPLEWRELKLENVSFEHHPGFGLAAVSLSLRAHEWLGVGGASGAGKTTLIDVVTGLIRPDSGMISVDGQPLTGETLERWRSGLAYVGQEGALFNDSVRGNLLAEGAAASDEQLWDALEIVGLARRIRAFPGGLAEAVGDRGRHLSGGERQRLVLAAALLRQPSLLLLDEATSALDAAGEAEVLARLRALDPRPAAMLVAHRESALAHCDSTISIRNIATKAGA